MKRSSEKFRIYLKQRLIKKKSLMKLLSLPLVMCLLSIVMMQRFKRSPSLGLFSVLMFLVSILIFLFILELTILFSRSVLEGIPKKPSLSSAILELLFFFGLMPFILGGAVGLNSDGKILILMFIAFVVIWVYRSTESYAIKHSIAGRIFTYTSISTMWYLVIVACVFLILIGFDLTVYPDVIKQALEPPINWKILLGITFLFVTTIVFFIIKESVFEYYSSKLASSASKSLTEQKKKCIAQIRERLDNVMTGDATHIDKISKEVQLLEKKIEYVNQEIEKIEKEFEFHGSFKLNIAVSPIGFLILEAVKDVPTIAEVFKSVFGPLFGL